MSIDFAQLDASNSRRPISIHSRAVRPRHDGPDPDVVDGADNDDFAGAAGSSQDSRFSQADKPVDGNYDGETRRKLSGQQRKLKYGWHERQPQQDDKFDNFDFTCKSKPESWEKDQSGGTLGSIGLPDGLELELDRINRALPSEGGRISTGMAKKRRRQQGQKNLTPRGSRMRPDRDIYGIGPLGISGAGGRSMSGRGSVATSTTGGVASMQRKPPVGITPGKTPRNRSSAGVAAGSSGALYGRGITSAADTYVARSNNELMNAIHPPLPEDKDDVVCRGSPATEMYDRVVDRSIRQSGAASALDASASKSKSEKDCIRVHALVDGEDKAKKLIRAGLRVNPNASSPDVIKFMDDIGFSG